MSEELVKGHFPTDIARYIVENHATIRGTGKYFNISRTTTHNVIMRKLPFIDYGLYNDVRRVMLENRADRGRRGGSATAARWRKIMQERLEQELQHKNE